VRCLTGFTVEKLDLRLLLGTPDEKEVFLERSVYIHVLFFAKYNKKHWSS